MPDLELPQQMRAAIGRSYGTSENITLETIPLPSPGEGKVLLKVIACGLNALDKHLHRGAPYLVPLSQGLRVPSRPTIGLDVAGIVVSIGSGCTRLSVGDAVFGQAQGALAEFVSGKEANLHIIPPGVSFVDAAALPIAGTTALQALDAASVTSGTRVLIHGASGGVGTMAVQIATVCGANITASCSAGNADIVHSLGAVQVLDYTRGQVLDPSIRYDAIIDTVGTLPFRESVRNVVRNGTVVRVGFGGGNWIGPLVPFLAAPLVSIGAPGRLVVLNAVSSLEALTRMAELVGNGDISPLIERVYPLSDIRSAFARLESGRTVGKSVVRVAPDPT